MTDARCPEAVELARLLDQQQRLAARVDQVDAAQRAATAAVQAAGGELVALEGSAALGGKVTPAKRQRQEAERVLADAKAAAAAPWG